MKKYILDASVILTFLLSEKADTVKKVTGLLRQTKDKKVKLYSSPLLPLEVTNGLRFSLIDEKQAGDILEIFLTLPIELQNLTDGHYLKALPLSYKLGTSVYDTSYHQLALSLGGTFVTADNKYFTKAKHLKAIELV